MKLYSFLLLLLLFSCSGDLLLRNIDNKEKVKKTEQEKEKTQIKEVSPEELSQLFYRTNAAKKKLRVTEEKIIVSDKKKVNPEDYTVIIDWMTEGVRFVKLRNKTTMNEYTIKEGTSNNNIVLLERTLFSYKFSIDGEIIEVKR